MKNEEYNENLDILKGELEKRLVTDAALWQQLAEEALELAHACLKMARKLTDEDSTPARFIDLKGHAEEEAADVKVCMDLMFRKQDLDKFCVDAVQEYKLKRWLERLGLKGEQNE